MGGYLGAFLMGASVTGLLAGVYLGRLLHKNLGGFGALILPIFALLGMAGAALAGGMGSVFVFSLLRGEIVIGLLISAGITIALLVTFRIRATAA